VDAVFVPEFSVDRMPLAVPVLISPPGAAMSTIEP
jgi:hypothetical protein